MFSRRNVERVDPQLAGQLVHRRLEREDHLPEAVAAERARRQVVRVDGRGVDALVRHGVDGDRLRAPVEHHPAGVVAVGAGVGQHVDRQRGQPARRGVAPSVTSTRNGCRQGATVNSSVAGHLVRHRPSGRQHGEGDEVLGEDLLLAAEAAADPGGEDAARSRGRSPKTCAISSRTRNGTCVLVRSTSRPSPSSQPMLACVSSATCATRCVRQRPRTTASASRSPASTSPCSPCSSATTLRAGLAMRDVDRVVVAVQQGGAVVARPLRVVDGRQHLVGRRRAPGSRPRRRRRSRRRTAATRCPRNRTTRSSTRVSSGSSSRFACRAVEKATSGASSAVKHGDHARAPRGPRRRRSRSTRAWACGLPSTLRCSRPGHGDVEGVRLAAGHDPPPGRGADRADRRRRPLGAAPAPAVRR